jgi:hypothetical protein
MHTGHSAMSEQCTASVEYVRQLMRRTAYTWAKSEGIDLIHDKSVPFKNDRKLVKNLYAGLRFFAQQQFDALTPQVDRDRCNEKTTG